VVRQASGVIFLRRLPAAPSLGSNLVRSCACLRTILLAALFVLGALPVGHAATHLPAPVRSAMQAAGIPASSIGVYVQDAASRKVVLAYNAKQPMNPASTMKLLTTYGGLELLGPAFTWKTEVFTNGSLSGDVLNGDLILKGYGDPKLTLEDFWLLLRDLRQRGLREIRGNLVLDKSYFDVGDADPGAFDNEPQRPYNVAPDALLVNFNVLRLRLIPETHGKLRIVIDPELPQLSLTGTVTLDNEPCGDWRTRITTGVVQGTNGTTINLGGRFSIDCGEKNLNLSLIKNGHYAYSLFKQLWSELGGRFNGELKSGIVPPGAQFFTRIESPPLAEIVRDINKYSNNVMARHVFLTLGAEQSGQAGSTANATQAINAWLDLKKLKFPELVLENGSGLSRVERISPQHLGMLLHSAFNSPVFGELESSLPIASVDGTMKKRLNLESVAGHAHIKTGTLQGVKAVAGYVFDKKGRRRVVVCLINGPQAAAGQAVQDALLQWVYNRP
jgi:serine-type D-Ala-D-Ala carboxypeptidase/endopeptidase (penicillin-binding protein 4)